MVPYHRLYLAYLLGFPQVDLVPKQKAFSLLHLIVFHFIHVA
uniref:Uncharacterized protein n=1 Tax=Arundo donax TaxID=35708 RepID=A0A0A9FFU7_ARUDO